MIQISYSDKILATQLAIYLADSLESNSSKIRTAKTLHHLVRKGSRQFRKTLRSEKDDILRKVANSQDPKVAKILTETRQNLFDDEIIAQDDLETEEEVPKPVLSGMGGSASQSGHGFGNTPISKENIGHKVLDYIDKTINVPDQRAEVLKMCLAPSNVGDYQPVQAPVMTSSSLATMRSSHISMSQSVFSGKKHVPGKAGGGWNSSEESENDEDNHLEKDLEQVSLEGSVAIKDVMIDSACEATEDDDLEEILELKSYLNDPNFPKLDEITDIFAK